MIEQYRIDLAQYRMNKAKETGEITIIATGPLTNIARAIQKAPVSMAKAKEIVFMGGDGWGGECARKYPLKITEPPNCQVCTQVEAGRFLEFFLGRMKT